MEGRKLGGRYEILSRVGGGGMAVVYKARDVLLNRYVAIKVLNESLSNDSEFVRRFSREAQAAASLSHPNVVGVYDVGQENHTHYIVMEYIEGPTLKEYIQQYSPLTTEEIVSIASQICDALAHAHENEIVHRDVKPHNILLGYNGRAKVTDFGIARATSSSTITQAGSVMGSVHYFSPEQARGSMISAKSDIYSLGVVLYEMVTGELPFDGDSAISIAMKHLQEPAIDPSQLNPNIPTQIRDIILKALAKNPDDRYPTVRAMKQDIDSVLHTGSMINEPRLRTGDEEDMPTKPIHAVNNGMGAASKPDAATQRSQVGQDTMANLERLRNVPADKDKTVLERTVVWLENVQTNMPWWQKVLFALFTFVVIICLTVFGFNAVWGIFNQGAEVEVPNLKGKTVAQAKVALEDKDLKAAKVQSVFSSAPKNTVVGQSIDAGKQMEKGSEVDLFVSSGSEKGKMIGTLGLKAPAAKRKLREMGFSNIKIAKEGYDSKYGEGEIYKQSPDKGDSVKTDEEVTLYVNDKNGTVKVPDWIGEYQSSLGGSGLRTKLIFWPKPGMSRGKVFATDPAPGELVKQDGVVKVWIADTKKGRDAEPPPKH
ncbi:Stk1 family PASTA domain-containing Ser/Thr kinase [Marininema halotolerans]|uniref:Serine/threonine-protein kinase PrkC n=1 Tax=Marininema halotolerans TaxID=1155944 RepID=A0A1I6QFR9_9BACL|nr:Stk1 family PASTA domain-containing Ser/Thr kinase [Marininema halotolerans]SFS51140.1 serine/threonine protein kinase [Marininema halotolerans]